MSELREIEDEMRQHPDPVLTVPELADRLERSKKAVRDDLKLLERDGAVGSKKTGSRAVAWWHEDRVAPRHVAPEDHPDQSALSEAAGETADGTGVEDQSAGWTPESAVGLLDVPGQGEVQERREEALCALLRHLRDGGEATTTELREATYSNHEMGYADAESFWANLGKKSLAQLRDEGVVTLVDGHAGRWAWSGDRFL